jgi:hypothetical protein
VLWSLTSQDMHAVGVPRGGDLAQHGQQGPALIPGSHPGNGHDRGPAAPVAPGPPLARVGRPTHRESEPGQHHRHADSMTTAARTRATRVTQPSLTQIAAVSART